MKRPDVIGLRKEIWQLEHVARHQAFDDMMSAKQKRDAGRNWLARAFNRFWYGGDYCRMEDNFQKTLSEKEAKREALERLIERHCKRPDFQQQVTREYTRQAALYHAYIDHKVALEKLVDTAEEEIAAYQRMLPPRMRKPEHTI